MRKGKKLSYVYSYQLRVPYESYELLSYRIVDQRRQSMKWILPTSVIEELKKKLSIPCDLQWSHLYGFYLSDSTSVKVSSADLLKEFDARNVCVL